jgi:hypothetical protein
MNVKVVYLVGMGRSGSTLTDILLDAHSGIQGLGGVRRLAHYARKQPCPCGAPSFRDCEFWSRVEANLWADGGRTLETVDVHARNPERFANENKALFRAAAAAGGTPFVTDNSKSVGRLARLLAVPDLQVIPVFVHRDPRGRAQSIRKRSGMRYAPTVAYTHRSLRAWWLLRNRPHIAVEYEALAADPKGQLERLMGRLGLEAEPEQLAWADQVHHNIGAADVLNKTEGSTIRPDDGWKTALPGYMQAGINAIAWPGRIANAARERRWGLR